MMTPAQRLGLDIVFNVSLWPVNLRVVPALVKSRHVQRKKPCPLYPWKRTFGPLSPWPRCRDNDRFSAIGRDVAALA